MKHYHIACKASEDIDMWMWGWGQFFLTHIESKETNLEYTNGFFFRLISQS